MHVYIQTCILKKKKKNTQKKSASNMLHHLFHTMYYANIE